MEANQEESTKSDIKGGKTLIGRIYNYQEKTKMSITEILNLPYIYYVLSMLDAPYLNYDKKEKKKEKETPNTAEAEAGAFTNFFK